MKHYIVAPDVQRIDGRRVPDDRVVQLSESAARYHLDTAQITEKTDKAAVKPAAKAADGGA
jgi:hypothetical protein